MASDNGRGRIGIIAASRIEAAPFADALGLEEMRDGRVVLFEGGPIVLVVSGIGKTNAAIATTYCCLRFQPRWILNVGAAGAAKDSFRIGDVVHVTSVVEYDRPRFSGPGPYRHQPRCLPGHTEVTCATQDRPVMARGHRAEVASSADIVDMEASAVVQSARRFGTACLIFKFISDTPLDPPDTDVIECIRQQSIPFSRFVCESVIPGLLEEDPA